MKKIKFVLLSFAIFIASCGNNKQQADLIVKNGIVYTVDSVFTVAQSFAVKEGKILAVGTNKEIEEQYESETVVDALGHAVFPGLIDAHCHFYGYGVDLKKISLYGTKSFDEILSIVAKEKDKLFSGWIFGRGWDQNDWDVKEYPDKTKLDSLFPNTPVFLLRIDGHAALVNSEGLRRAKINANTKVKGGAIEYIYTFNESWTPQDEIAEIKHMGYPFWEPTGLLIDNAVDIVKKVIANPSRKDEIEALLIAQKNCFEVGLTTVDDAGIDYSTTVLLDSLQKNNLLKMRVYAMLTPNEENLNHYLQKGIYKTERLSVRSFKFYADGALGSRGACLLKDYADKKNHKGFLLNEPKYFAEMAAKILEKGFQMNTHCIGDSADRFILETYGQVLKGKNENRWRIEHCQVMNEKDIKLFQENNIIPSVQPTHATSDMYWAKDRLGEERVKYAYAYKELLNAAGKLALGTDFPVEDISPIKTFYAAVVRKDAKGFPENGFQMENALTREETLKGMTIWAAYANFEEKEKGSIEKGKFADFVILDTDIMKCDAKKILNTKVAYTYINGEKVFGK